MTHLQLSILGRLPSTKKADQGQSIREMLSITQLADQLGFERAWLTEHHSCLLDSSPEVLLPLMAATTRRIRVGTAGILLYYYPPYKVARTFQLLSTLFPGRIDLGVCSGRVADRAAHEGMPLSEQLDFIACNHQLRHHMDLNREHYAALAERSALPEHWVVGTGYGSMTVAAQTGASFCYSLCHSQTDSDPQVLAAYRQQVVRRSGDPVAQTAVLVAGVCAPTDAEAAELAAAYVSPWVTPTIVGSARHCVARLREVAERFGTTQIVWWDLAPIHEEAERSLRLLANEAGLDSEPAASQPPVRR